MAGRLEGKVCVITGAASGIGAVCAALFIEEGASVAGVDAVTGAVGQLSLQVDVTNEERVRARLPATDRQAFLRVARILSELPPEQIAGPLIRWPRPAAPGNVGRTNRPEEVRPITAVAGWALPASMDVRLT